MIHFFNFKSGIIVNKFDLNRNKAKEKKKIADQYGSDFLGEIPYNKAFTRAQLKGISVIEYENSPLTERIVHIWKKIQERIFAVSD